MQRLPKEDYDKMIGSCDVGLIFLDHRFTIPNFPSRLLAYMKAKLPVIACTDRNTDIGIIIVDGGFGWWCESDKAEAFKNVVASCRDHKTDRYGMNAFSHLLKEYTSKTAYETIIKHYG